MDMELGKNLKEKSEKANEKKPPRKMKTLKTQPVVRQTLTSYKRMLKANPLLELEEAGIDVDEVIAQKSLMASMKSGSLDPKTATALHKQPVNNIKKPERKPLVRTQSLKVPKTTPSAINNYLGFKKPTIISGNQPLPSNNNSKKPLLDTGNGVIPNKPKPRPEIKAKVNSFPKGVPKPKPTNNNNGGKPKTQTNITSNTKNSTLRRSLSHGHLQTKKGLSFDPKQAFTKLNHSQSEEHLCVAAPSPFKRFSPITEANGIDEDFVFKTPSAYDRRSICRYTPRSNRKSSLFHASTPAPVEMQKLQERLNKWLKSRGKPAASFHCLRVFGSNGIKKSPPLTVIDDENKENIEVIEEKTVSYENLNIVTTPEKNNAPNNVQVALTNEMSEQDIAKYAKEAMSELLKLIEEDYPSEQCLGWLELIRGKYKNIDDEPEYWECRAAIEQCAGNVGNAVEFYKTAIIQGAEVTAVDKSLDQLLKKFSLLNISPTKATSTTEQKGHGKGDKERIVREARNVFKSSIIQFAVRERNINSRKNQDEPTASSAQTPQKKLVATPVRRSTRLSRSGFTNTSGVKICKSLREIDLSSEEISFEKNKALC